MNDTLDLMPRTLPRELSDRLREMIIRGELEPGAKINERALCDLFGVSRTPLREAMQTLAAEGLVEIRPRRGAAVTALTVADLEEVFPIMGALEALAGRLACARAEPSEIAAARKHHDAMTAAYRAGDLSEYFRLNERIHETIFAAARNETLVQMQGTLAGRIRRARYRANMSPARWAAAVEEHEAIIAAFEARDGERLAAILTAHLANKLATVRESLGASERR